MANQSDLTKVKGIVDKLDNNRAQRFSYTWDAFKNNDADGVTIFDVNDEQNIPVKEQTDYAETVLDNGIRADGASIPRMGWNHFLGRFSYNLNKLVQQMCAFFGINTAMWAHNCAEYDAGAEYARGDACYLLGTNNGVQVCTRYVRTSVSPATIKNIPPTTALHWSPVQEEALVVHADQTSPHSATSTPTANRIAMFDGDTRLKSGAAPSADNDVARKAEMDAEASARAGADFTHAALTEPHSATATPTANRIAMYGADGRLKSGAVPSADNDVARKAELDAEATARAGADSAEAEARAAADSAEAEVRAAADNAEAEARINADAAKAPLASPAFTGTPTAPTAAAGTNTTQVATTEFVRAALDTYFYIGKMLEQYPDEPSPVEAGLPGTWEMWSSKAIMYGVSTSTLPAYSKYSDLTGSSIAAGSRPYVVYEETGGDFRLYRFNSHAEAYAVPNDFDPVQWERYSTNVTVVERQKAGNALSDNDYTIGTRITSGAHTGKYITEKIVPGGKFFGVEGVNRPTFISGGVQGGRIKNIEYTHGYDGITASGIASSPTGALELVLTQNQSANGSPYNAQGGRFHFNASRVVTTGPDVAGTNVSKRFWRRVN